MSKPKANNIRFGKRTSDKWRKASDFAQGESRAKEDWQIRRELDEISAIK